MVGHGDPEPRTHTHTHIHTQMWSAVGMSCMQECMQYHWDPNGGEVSPDASAEAIPKHIFSECNLAKNGHVDRTPIDMELGCHRQTVPLAP